MTAVTDHMLDLFEAAEAAHTFTHGGDYRRCCNRAGLEAVAPHIAARALQVAADQVEAVAGQVDHGDAHGDGVQDGYIEVAYSLRGQANALAAVSCPATHPTAPNTPTTRNGTPT